MLYIDEKGEVRDMGDRDQVRELIANLTRSPRGDRLLLRGQLGMTYEKATIRSKFAFLSVLPSEILNNPVASRSTVLMNAMFFTSCVYGTWHTEESYSASPQKKKFEEMLADLYERSDTDSARKRIEDILGMHTGNATFYKILGNYVRQFKNDRKMGSEIDEENLAMDLIFWDIGRQRRTDTDGIEHSIISVQEKWANTIVRMTRAEEEHK